MTSMRYISEVPSGYLVRKAVNGRLYQGFFGETRFGTIEKALDAAIKYRDDLLKEVEDQRSFQRHNARNVTGVVGVAWHCRPNHHRNGAVIHSFRAQVANDDGKTLSKAWSISRHGLWGAYEQAVRWRHMIAFGRAVTASEIVKSFLGFMSSLIEAANTQPEPQQKEIRQSIVDMVQLGEAPKAAISMVPKALLKQAGVKSPSSGTKKVASKTGGIKTSESALPTSELDLYDTSRTSIV